MPKKNKVKAPSLRDQVIGQLRASPQGVSSQEITDSLGLKKGARVRAHLRKLAEQAVVKREGPQNKAKWRLVDEVGAGGAAEGGVPETALTESLIDAMAATRKPWKAKELAKDLDLYHLDVRTELVILEDLGVVYRTGRTRGTRWHLG
jgi:predicted ArsR family transcriptional regulator